MGAPSSPWGRSPARGLEPGRGAVELADRYARRDLGGERLDARGPRALEVALDGARDDLVDLAAAWLPEERG